MDACHPQHPHGDADFTRSVPAAPSSVAQLTRQVNTWLDREVRIDTQRTSDVVLATYEALANCADHAYRSHEGAGMMTLEVTYDRATETVHVCVTDHGSWINPDTQPANNTRGRGLRLMQALCDDFTINGTEDGTTVCLHFERCPGVAAAAPTGGTGERRARSSSSAEHQTASSQ